MTTATMEALENTMEALIDVHGLAHVLEAINTVLLIKEESEPNARKRAQFAEWADLVAETVDAL